MDADASLQLALDLARRAGALVADARADNRLDLSYKRGVELLTSADLEADRLICSGIRAHAPEDSILSEESSAQLPPSRWGEGPLWVVDPIDGTVNYAYGHSQVAISIAYLDGGQVQAGVVHTPFQGETFIARRGGGAALNGRPIHASGCRTLEHALVGTGFPYERARRDALVDRLQRVLRHCRDIRRVGSAALDLCWVACGRLDAFYETLCPWDIAAGRLVAAEAGASLGHLQPAPPGVPAELWGEELVASAPGVYAAFVALLKG